MINYLILLQVPIDYNSHPLKTNMELINTKKIFSNNK